MKIAPATRRNPSVAGELDMQTIRRRVANIKNHWSPEVAQARAAEGIRRRRELDALVEGLLSDLRDNDLVNTEEFGDLAQAAHGLTLIG